MEIWQPTEKTIWQPIYKGAESVVSKPILGNVTQLYNPSYSGGNFTFDHTHNDGDDGHLFLFLCVNGGYNGIAAKYNGASFTKAGTLQDITGAFGFGCDWVVFDLDDPATGTNQIEVLPGAAYNDKIYYFAISYTNCSGLKQDPAKQKESSAKIATASFSSPVTEGSSVLAMGAQKTPPPGTNYMGIPTDTYISPQPYLYAAPGTNLGVQSIGKVDDMAGGEESVSWVSPASQQMGIMAVEIGGAAA